jgi:hypothetical protein
LLALVRRSDIGEAIRPWILKLERKKRWAAERAAIQAEVARAKKTSALVRLSAISSKYRQLHFESGVLKT